MRTGLFRKASPALGWIDVPMPRIVSHFAQMHRKSTRSPCESPFKQAGIHVEGAADHAFQREVTLDMGSRPGAQGRLGRGSEGQRLPDGPGEGVRVSRRD